MGNTKEYLLIDGYNIINSWPNLKGVADESLEEARDLLIDILRDYQGYVGTSVIIVFDAHLLEGGVERHLYFGEVEVVYTKEGETADQYIERWVDAMGEKYRVRVASSDFLEQTIILSRGGTRVSARELYLEIEIVTKKRNDEYICKNIRQNNQLSDNLSPEVLEILEQMRRQT